jgi:hypothetical protein
MEVLEVYDISCRRVIAILITSSSASQFCHLVFLPVNSGGNGKLGCGKSVILFVLNAEWSQIIDIKILT